MAITGWVECSTFARAIASVFVGFAAPTEVALGRQEQCGLARTQANSPTTCTID